MLFPMGANQPSLCKQVEGDSTTIVKTSKEEQFGFLLVSILVVLLGNSPFLSNNPNMEVKRTLIHKRQKQIQILMGFFLGRKGAFETLGFCFSKFQDKISVLRYTKDKKNVGTSKP